MKDITENEMNFILIILKNPEHELNARNISKIINITPMGSLKISKRLEKQGVISSKLIGKSLICKLNFDKDYVKQYVKFLLQREAEYSAAYVKMWIRELKKIKSANAIILFGSVLKKEKAAGDIDSLIVVNKKSFEKVKKEVENINSLNEKKIHPLYQTKEDLEKHIKERNPAVLNAIKGIIVLGEDDIIEILQ